MDVKHIPTLARRMATLKPEGAYAVLSKATKLEETGKHIIHFEIGQPDFPTPSHIAQAGIHAIEKGFTKYNPPLGIFPLRSAIAKELSDSYHRSVDEEQIAVTPSGKTAIFVAMSAILERGDEVIYPNPGFPTYQTLVDYFDCIRKPIPLLEHNSFSFDMNVFRKLFSRKTKLIILNSPSNPTGGVMPLRDIRAIAEMVKGTNCWVMTDEMYAHTLYDDIKYPSYFGLKERDEKTILVGGFSKTFSMTGWRIGYMAVPKAIIHKIDYLLTHTVGCTATFTQYAALEGIKGSKKPLIAMVKEFERRRNYVVSELNTIPGIRCQKPEGAFYVFPNVSSFRKSSKDIADYILMKAGVALLDGTSFGDFGEGYLRISYATSMETLTAGMLRIRKALRKL